MMADAHDAPARVGALVRTAFRAEVALGRAASRIATRWGWTAAVLPYPGYGGGGHVRVLGRVLLAPARTQPAARKDVPGWQRFLTLEQPGASVQIEVGGSVAHARGDEAGLIDTTIEASPPPGPAVVRLHAGGRDPVEGVVHVAPAEATLGVVCDIDDTVWITGLNTPLRAAWRTLAKSDQQRRPVPGMSRLLGGLLEGHVATPVIYLSTGAWNLAGPVASFLDRHGFPPGALLMTDWGLSPRGWFRDGKAHKREALERLARDLPQVRWVLIGDDGQHDPDLYREFARTHPDRVAAIALRRIRTVDEQLLGEQSPAHDEDKGAVPVVWASDGDGLLPEVLAIVRPEG